MTQVFVLCTGRCGSTTLAKACAHITNFSSGHETRTHLIGAGRLDYPANHIEIDNRLSFFLGRLEARFGDAPHFVHLTRDRAAVARSFAARADKPLGLFRSYRDSLLLNLPKHAPQTPDLEVAGDLVDMMTENITQFLRGRPRVMTMRLETIDADFPRFWDWIGAEGDLEAAKAEWGQRYNATPQEKSATSQEKGTAPQEKSAESQEKSTASPSPRVARLPSDAPAPKERPKGWFPWR